MRYVFAFALSLMASIAYGGTATLNWVAPTTNTDGSAITGAISYKVYGAAQGSTKALLATVSALTWQHTNAPNGTTQCYQVTATVNGAESARSVESCKLIPVPVPNPPTITTIEVVAGIGLTPAFKILADGSRSTAVAGFVPMGKACTGPVAFTYRGKSYRRVAPSDVKWWNTAASPDVAAACA